MSNYPITRIPNNPLQTGMSEITHDVVFSKAGGQEIKMSLILPKPTEGSDKRIPYPTIVFLQGSGWTAPCIYYQIPQMSHFAAKGYAVAMITHRNSRDGYPFPAFLVDAKCAVRYLRANAELYGIDPDKICFWGTSSGGNTALLMGLTGDDPRYKSEEYAEYSDKVQAVIDCFGPSDLPRLLKQRFFNPIPADSTFAYLAGTTDLDHADKLIEMSPLLQLEGKRDLPPFLILQGDADPVVEYEQSELMYKALVDAGHQAEMIAVEGAPHEGSFWSFQLLDLAGDFIKRTIG
ncbi:MAG: alpha/beta hydrolase [Clostridia bacterium]|nr:alpha/beta hydrolase [Clostridia bacterium]